MEISSDYFAPRVVPIQDVLASLRETIKSQSTAADAHEPTPTEYFAAIISVLKGGDSEHLEAFLQILVTVLAKTNHAVIQSQFQFIAGFIIEVMRGYSDDVSVLKNAIDILGSIGCAVDASDGFWSKPDALRVINALFAFIDDERNAVRKATCHQLKAIILIHKNKTCRATRSYASDFFSEVFKSCTRSNYKRSLFIVMFLEDALPCLPDTDITKLFPLLMSLIECSQPSMTAAVFRTMDCLFQSSISPLSAEAMVSALRVLLQQQGKTVDMQANALFYSSLCSGVLSVHKKSANALSTPVLSDFMNCFIFGCESEISEIHCAIGNALKRIMNVYIAVPGAGPFSSQKKDAKPSAELLKKVSFFAEHLTHLLTPRFQNSWLYIMDSVRFFFERLSMTIPMNQRSDLSVVKLLIPLVKGIAGIVNMISTGMLKVSPGADSALEVALAGALASLGGPVLFVKILVPSEYMLLEVGEGGDLSAEQKGAFVNVFERNKVWLLRFLKRHMKMMPCSLNDFAGVILPIIDFLKSHSLSASSETTQAIEDFWTIFPEFCASYDTRDITDAFPKLIGTLSTCVESYCRNKRAGRSPVAVEISPIFLGLTNIAKVVLSRCDPVLALATPTTSEASVLSGYAQVVLPLLITFLEISELNDKLFQSSIQCLEAWSGLAPANLLGNISKKMLQLLLMTSAVKPSATANGESDGVVAAKYMSIILAIIPRLSASMVQLLYRTIKPLLSVNEIVTVQKRSYLVLRALLTDRPRDLFEKETPKDVLSMLGESFLLCHVSARSMRLECMELVIRAIDSSLNVSDQCDNALYATTFADACHMILGEVLISQKDSNGKCRMAAISLLKCLIMRVPSASMLVDLCSAVAGETPTMRSSAIGGLALLMQMRKRSDPTLFATLIQLLPTIALLLVQNNTEETRSILSLYRVLVSSAPPDLLLPMLPEILRTTLAGNAVVKAKFMKKTRKITRKALERFGSLVIGPMIPASDSGLLSYLERLERRKERKRGGKSTTASSFNEAPSEYMDDDSDANDSGSDISAFNGTMGGALSTKSRADSIDELADMVNQHYADSQETGADYRLDKRRKATFAGLSDMGRNGASIGSLPTTLDDLMEDQGPNKRGARSHKGAGSVFSVAQGNSKKRSRGDDNESIMDVSDGSMRPPMARKGGAKSVGANKGDVDEKYSVRFDDAGVLVVEENDEAPPAPENISMAEDMNSKDNYMARVAAAGAPKKTKTVHEPGEEYRSKRAGGDVWKRGMLEPHAYVPLDGRLLAKKNTASAVSHFGSLMKGSRGIEKKQINTKHNQLSRNAKKSMRKGGRK